MLVSFVLYIIRYAKMLSEKRKEDEEEETAEEKVAEESEETETELPDEAVSE